MRGTCRMKKYEQLGVLLHENPGHRPNNWSGLLDEGARPQRESSRMRGHDPSEGAARVVALPESRPQARVVVLKRAILEPMFYFEIDL